MDSSTIDALHGQVLELARQIVDLQSNVIAAEHGKDAHVQAIPCLTVEQERTPPNATKPPAYTQNCLNCLNCSCKSSPARARNTCTAGRGVYLGLLRAGDLAALSERALNELDDGLKAIALNLVPRAAGAPPATSTDSPLSRTKQEMIALLNKVSLRIGPVPGGSVEHFAAFRDPARGRNFRLEDARLGQFGLLTEGPRMSLMYFETFLQLLQARGIDVDALP
ncbi:hypothetical protein DFP73DRAFT_567270 [Morchella snyderi]|nr:hypothetical protein DFP73DRAFT_567270 [Morchella snyderi]